ncbi:MAG: hypothetical protein DRI80_09195 [Chloroflexota bacterium]|nr:MAG: hypothetical protein DRI80_09195 [Chloroflexota bacterium]
MILLNFAHPLTPDQVSQIEALSGQPVTDVRHLPAQFDHDQPFASQAVALADACDLSPTEWQTLPLLVNPPSLNFIAVTLLAELHGRMGYFPTMVRMRPVPGSTPPRFEVAELVNLQAVRNAARQRRSGETTG